MSDDEWWNEVFVDHGEVYAEVLESKRSQAASEVDFLVDCLRERGVEPGALILDVACGIGRHAVEFADRGYRVTGVDLSATLLERARRLAAERDVEGQVNFARGDMRELGDLFADGQFDAIVNLFSSFGFFDEPTNRSVLEACAGLSTDGAVFAIDTINRDWLMRNFQSTGVMADGGILTIERRDFDFETGRSHSRWSMLRPADEDTLVKVLETEVDLRVYALHELIERFEATGWNYGAVYGGLNGEEFGLGSPRIVGVFERQ